MALYKAVPFILALSAEKQIFTFNFFISTFLVYLKQEDIDEYT